jgi:hypothetical protein
VGKRSGRRPTVPRGSSTRPRSSSPSAPPVHSRLFASRSRAKLPSAPHRRFERRAAALRVLRRPHAAHLLRAAVQPVPEIDRCNR